MKNRKFKNSIIMMTVLSFLMSFSYAQIDTKSNELLIQNITKNYFIENNGQWPKEVKYLAKVTGTNVWITNEGVVYDHYTIEANYNEQNLNKISDDRINRYKQENSQIKGHVVKSIFKNHKSSKQFISNNKQRNCYNYFIGNDKSKWVNNVHLFESVVVEELYQGIDIKYYFDKGMLRYDYIVNPGADVAQIKIAFEGIENFIVNKNGELELGTSLGIVKHQDIFAYQNNINGKKQKITTSFKKIDNKTIGFDIKNYNKNKELIIDPLVYSTFLGTSTKDVINSLKVDDEGNVYVVGFTSSYSFPTSTGAYQENMATIYDMFVSKLNSDGTGLIYSTYLGGNDDEEASELIIDDNGNVYITGRTSSDDFPTTSGAYDTDYYGGTDAFITKLNSDGTALVFSTFLGANKWENSTTLTLDNDGNIFVAGQTTSTNFPVTSGAFQTSYDGTGGETDGYGFVTKLNSDATALIYSTYLGGADDGDIVKSIALDNNGNAVVVGHTLANDFPVTSGAFQTEFDGVLTYDGDAFIAKLNSDGTDLIFATYLGGTENEKAFSVKLDNENNIYLAGNVNSDDFPTTTNAFQTSFTKYQDAFVTKLSSDGTSLIYSTYIGGNNRDYINSLIVNSSGCVFVTGKSKATNLPSTEGTYQENSGGRYDAFVIGLNSTGTEVIYSTYLGGSNDDEAYSIDLSNDGNLYVGGYTKSTNFPISNGVYRTDLEDDRYEDGFITKISPLLITGIDKNEMTSSKSSLSQNYPNPFNQKTIISYSISSKNNINISVYNEIGQKVAVLVNKKQSAGSYNVTFDGSYLSGGIYYYKIITGNNQQIEKMLLIK